MRRRRARDLVRKMRERLRKRRSPTGAAAAKHTPLTRRRTRRLKRKAAFALSAGVIGFNSGVVGAVPLGQPAIQYELLETAANKVERRVHASSLSASDTLRESLIEEEGVRNRVYRDVAGYLTVGVGHLVKASDNLRLGQRISDDRVLDLLDQDIAIAEEGVRELVGDLPLYQHEFDALVDLVFNVGAGNVAPHKSPRLNHAIDDADYEGMADELHYVYAGGETPRGLALRSERRAKIFLEANYENPRDRA